MRASLLALVSTAFLAAAPAIAADTPKDVKGLFLLTDYPAMSVQPGTTSTVALRLQNYGLNPERYSLSVGDVPSGWSATLLGGGQPVAAAMPATDSSVSLQLRLEVPATAGSGTKTLTVKAEGQGGTSVTLPIAVTLTKELPAKLKVEAPLPALRGTLKSTFDYQLTIKNDSGRNLTVSFVADAPKYFETNFTENYGSQQLTSMPIDAGQSKDVKLHVRPPSIAGAQRYPVSVTVSAEDASAKTNLSLEIVGQPQLTVSSREGLVSAKAEAGKTSTLPIVVTNTGTAPADNVELSATPPTGWKIEFNPKTIDHIDPNKNAEVQADITPTATSLAGDYQAAISATARGEAASTQFRVTVATSNTWIMAGGLVIGVAVLFMVAAVARFGRR
jgi:uncharacterized repeat protein (TIGR01451 family)